MTCFFGYTEDEIRKILGDKYKDKYRPFMSWIIKDSPYEKIFFELFNCSFEEFANAIIEKQYSQLQKDQMKMTREEAIKKCANTFNMKKMELGDIPITQLLDMLEALGLIKFDERLPKDIIKDHLFLYMDPIVKAEEIIDTLSKAGYKIERI